MTRIYCNLIKVGLWTIERVPQIWKNDVQALLDADVAVEVVSDAPSGVTTMGSGIQG